MGVADLIKKFESITKDVDHSAETVRKEGSVDDVSDAVSDHKICEPAVSAGINTLDTSNAVEPDVSNQVASVNEFDTRVSTASKEDVPYEEDLSLVNEDEDSQQVLNDTFEEENKDVEEVKETLAAVAIGSAHESIEGNFENGKDDEDEDQGHPQDEHEHEHENEDVNAPEPEQEPEQECEQENEEECEQENEQEHEQENEQEHEQEYENEEHDQDDNEIDNDLDNENEVENDNDAENDHDNDNELDQDKKDDSRKRSLKKKNSKKKNNKKKNAKKSAPGSKGAATEKLAAASGGVNTLRQA